ncbi:hypothetical protein PRK78_004523 [Emydomyces testavorans]|uniref:Cytochrome oxidase c assembly-domain-containing protein n=1 Tax=Emydomyces testavorans TaxID=2070801 RepID=A0AAF0DI71_9EURO|nr:hypothetical protein PRK78_004523 [Emydomyces testavorans]
MSRSAIDATRFTATAPHAYSKPSSSFKLRNSQGVHPSSGGQNQETPRQKVERLRAEARAARIAKSSSPLDRLIERGRVWADRAHRVTVFCLIAASGIAGILTIYSATSLIAHNRRQKALWIDKEVQRLLDAKKAYVAGNATPEQIDLLEKEKAGDEEKRRREELKKDTAFYKAKNWLFGGMKPDDVGQGALVGQQPEIEREPPRVLEAINAKAAETVASRSVSREGMEDARTDATQANTYEPKKSWTGWLTGR